MAYRIEQFIGCAVSLNNLTFPLQFGAHLIRSTKSIARHHARVCNYDVVWRLFYSLCAAYAVYLGVVGIQMWPEAPVG